MKTWKLEFNTPDDFEPGYCMECPIHQDLEWDDDGYVETDTVCPLLGGCPLEEIKK